MSVAANELRKILHGSLAHRSVSTDLSLNLACVVLLEVYFLAGGAQGQRAFLCVRADLTTLAELGYAVLAVEVALREVFLGCGTAGHEH